MFVKRLTSLKNGAILCISSNKQIKKRVLNYSEKIFKYVRSIFTILLCMSCFTQIERRINAVKYEIL